ncbi:MAG: ATP synthase F1 subunit gamma [Myxococcota bacterium]|nr:ATP synthase F1 subunit gamma [Myxococcota bacterium]
MPSLKDIRKRIGSVKNTQKITRAMKLVSGAKLRRAQQAMDEFLPYASKYREMLHSLMGQTESSGAVDQPLLTSRDTVEKRAVLVVSSDRGLCGSFNSAIQKELDNYVKRNGADTMVFPLGRRVSQFTKKQEYVVGELFGEVIPAADYDVIKTIAKRLTDGFTNGEFDEVVILSNRFKSVIAQIPTEASLLPIQAEEEAGEDVETVAGDILYEPDQSMLLGHVAPRYVEVQIRGAILESIAGEHAARMNAMNSATDNASELISSLTLQMNRARQAAITTELMEIIGGAEALK